MKLLFIGLAVVHVIVFSYLFFSKVRSRGTYGFHRNLTTEKRRKRGDLIEFDTIEINPANSYMSTWYEHKTRGRDFTDEPFNRLWESE